MCNGGGIEVVVVGLGGRGVTINSLQKCHAMMVMVGADSNEGIDLQ